MKIFDRWVARCGNIARNQLQESHYDSLNHSRGLNTKEKFNEPAEFSSDISSAAFGSNPHDDPTDISRLQISDSERQRRRSQGLCLACGQSGHIARDHHRKFNPIPMPKRANYTLVHNRKNLQDTENRSNSRPQSSNSRVPFVNHQFLPSHTQMPMSYYPPIYPQLMPQQLSQQPAQSRLRAIVENPGYVSDTSSDHETPVGGRKTSGKPDQLKGKPLI